MNIFDPQGPIAAADATILVDSVAIMLAIVVPTIIAIFAFAFWFRQSNPRAFYHPDWAYSGRIELVVWSIPALGHPTRRRRLDRLAPARSCGSHPGYRQSAPDSGRLARLEMAVHLSGPADRHRQHVDRTGGRATEPRADLG
jgi:hypothetical protein